LEKPLADSVMMGSMLIDAAATSTANLGVCFQNRYNATSVALKSALTSGEYGKPLGARAQVMWTRTADYYHARPWRGTKSGSGGGVLMNQAIHTIDLVQWLLGDVTDVRGATAALLFGDVIEVEDTAVGVLQHEQGIRTNFYATLTHFEHAPVFIEVRCEKATLTLNGDLVARRPDGSETVLAEPDQVGTARTYWGASHERLITDFYRAIAAGEHFWIDAPEAAKSLRIAQAFYA
jgi:predicted dehydrogenase